MSLFPRLPLVDAHPKFEASWNPAYLVHTHPTAWNRLNTVDDFHTFSDSALLNVRHTGLIRFIPRFRLALLGGLFQLLKLEDHPVVPGDGRLRSFRPAAATTKRRLSYELRQFNARRAAAVWRRSGIAVRGTGKDLSASEPVERQNPDSPSFAGVSAQISVSGASIDGYVMAVSAVRIDVLLPRQTPVGAGTVILKVNGTELSAPIEVVDSAPGIRTRSAAGAAFVLDASAAEITASHPAAAGDLVRIRTTGLAPTAN